MAIVRRFLPVLVIAGLAVSALSIFVRINIERDLGLDAFREAQLSLLETLKFGFSQNTASRNNHNSEMQSFVQGNFRHIAFELSSSKYGTEYLYTRDTRLIANPAVSLKLVKQYPNYLFIPGNFYTLQGELYTVLGVYEPVSAHQFTLFVRDAILLAAIILFVASLYYFVSMVFELSKHSRYNTNKHFLNTTPQEDPADSRLKQYTEASTKTNVSTSNQSQFPSLREFRSSHYHDELPDEQIPPTEINAAANKSQSPRVSKENPDQGRGIHHTADSDQTSTIQDPAASVDRQAKVSRDFNTADRHSNVATQHATLPNNTHREKVQKERLHTEVESENIAEQPARFDYQQEPLTDTMSSEIDSTSFLEEYMAESEERDSSEINNEMHQVSASAPVPSDIVSFDQTKKILESEITRAIKTDTELVVMKLELMQSLQTGPKEDLSLLLRDLPAQENLYCRLDDTSFLLLFPNETIQNTKIHAEHLHKTIRMMYNLESRFAITALSSRLIEATELLRELDLIKARAAKQGNPIQAFSPDSEKYYELRQNEELKSLTESAEKKKQELLPPPEVVLEITRDLI